MFSLDSWSHSLPLTTLNGVHSSSILCSDQEFKQQTSLLKEVGGGFLQSGAPSSFMEGSSSCSRGSIDTSTAVPFQTVEGPRILNYLHTQSTPNELKRRRRSSEYNS